MEKTGQMGDSPPTSTIKEANFKYLKTIPDYIDDWLELKREIDRVKSKQEQLLSQRSAILQEWQQYEAQKYKVLEGYIEKNTLGTHQPNEEGLFTLSDKQPNKIAALSIGEKTIYVSLWKEATEDLPLELIWLD